MIYEDNPEFEETGMSNKPVRMGLNDQVTHELMQHQFNSKMNNKQQQLMNKFKPGMDLQQREFEEAMELDRILEEERRQQAMQFFKNKAENKYDDYMNKLETPNVKNVSKGMAGVLGGFGDTGGAR